VPRRHDQRVGRVVVSSVRRGHGVEPGTHDVRAALIAAVFETVAAL
jgi:hypothetical protein